MSYYNYVDKADKIIKELYSPENAAGYRGNKNGKITTSQIRGLLSGISDIYNDVVRLDTNELNKDIKDRILYLKVQFVYESGREAKVKAFIEKTEMLKCIDNALKGRKEFIEMARYMEALVAFHRYYGGKDE